MNLGEIITRVQTQFGDTVEAQITKEDIVRWVNDACLEIVTSNHTNQGSRVGHAPLVAGQGEYDLPSDLYLIRAARANGKVIKATTYEQIINTYAGYFADTQDNIYVGEPKVYWLDAGKIKLVPAPAESLGSLDIMYVKRPDVLTVVMTTVEPDVPREYHPRIVEYCIAQASEADDNLQAYQIKMNEFQQNLTKLKQNGEQPESDGAYPHITYVSNEGDWLGGYYA